MKGFFLSALAFCFILAGNPDAFSQTRTVTKKQTKAKLVKCYEKGKVVYRTKCRLKKKPTTEVKTAKVEKKSPIYGIIPNVTGTGGGMGSGNGQGNGTGTGNGRSDGAGNGNSDENSIKKETPLPNAATTALKILTKPRPNYTDSARVNMVLGKVVLRVTFSANGTIGAISVIRGLGNGLTEESIAAARKIKFEPATKSGVSYSVTKVVEYNFIPE